MDITWDTQSIPGNVQILLSTDGGLTFTPIAASTPNDGIHPWTVPTSPSVNCVLKIVPLSQPDKDTSVGLFSILDPAGNVPEVLSIVPTGPNPTNASAVSFTATFSETVFGVSEDDFHLTTTGTISGARITGVFGIGNSYAVQVGGISGEGTVRVNFVADCLVKNGDAVPVTNDRTGSAVFIDQVPPQVQSIALFGPAHTSATEVQFLVDFGEILQGVDDSDFRIVRTGLLYGGTIAGVQESSGRYVVTVSGYSSQGNLGLELFDDDSIADDLGNPLGGPGAGNGDFTAGESYAIDLEPEIRVLPSALTLVEPDGSATLTLSLSSRPAAPVTIHLYSLNQNECALTHVDGVAVSGDPVVVLDADNWSGGVSVTVAAKADYRPDGDSVTRILITPASSSDAFYDGMDPSDPTVTVRDAYDGLAATGTYPTSGEIGTPLDLVAEGVGFGGNPMILLGQWPYDIYPISNATVNPQGTQISMTLPAVYAEGPYDLLICNGTECTTQVGAVTFLDPEAAEKMKRKKAVIVSGGDPGDILWPATRNCAGRAYRALLDQGYSHENIRYLSADPAVGDVDETATRESLEHALLYWAKGLDNPNRNNDVPPEYPAEELIVYMMGHGDQRTFEINGTSTIAQRIEAEELAEWFRILQYVSPAMPGKLIFVYDACLAGSFLAPLANPGTKERYVVASVPDQTRAWFLDDGEFSFSRYFWDKVRIAGRLYRSFASARDLLALGQDQQAQIDIDGDGLPDSIDLDAIGTDVIIGRGRIAASDPPEIGRVMADGALDCERSLDVWVSDLYARYGIDDVWAMVESPADSAVDPREPGIYRERLPLLDHAHDGVYGNRYSQCVRNGTYRFFFYMKDRKGVAVSALRQAVVRRECDASLSDVVWILKTLVGILQPAPDSGAFQRMDRDENGRLGLPDAVETLRLVGEM